MSNRDYNIILAILVTIACIIAAVLAYFLYGEISGSSEPPTPAPVTATPSAPDDAWQRIQFTGKMRAGTSADYPPFAFRTDEFILDGFDIAVINEIGRRLGVTIELDDMAFEGLGGALQVEQIDVAIAGLSITPERLEVVNFSEVYFVSEDAILAKEEANIPQLLHVEEMAPFRIGVQRNTVFSNWLNETLVATGKMTPSQLVEYEDISFAVRDLREGRIDLVLLDLPPAEVAVGQGGVKLVGQGLNKQFFGIGIPKEEPTLQAQVNTALAAMKADGTLAALTEKYMGVSQPLPPTLTPTATSIGPTTTPGITVTPSTCVDGMQYVSDLNLDDNNMTTPPVMEPGQRFKKGWRIKNTGTCTWDSRYKLTYAGGNSPESQMGGQPTPIQGLVPPGGVYDIFVDMVAPLKPGVYQGFWQMRNQWNQTLGRKLWVGIQVPAQAPLTPPPTQTKTPGITFTVDRTQISAGECVTFKWSATNVQSVYFYQQGESWQQYPVPHVGSSVECPGTTTIYELRVVKLDGTAETRQITIYVQPNDAPSIDRFTVNPPSQIGLGQVVEITWQVSGDVDKVQILRDDTLLWDNAPFSSRMEDTPQAVGQVNYIIEATGKGGTSRSQHSIAVTPRVTVPPITETPTKVPPITETPTKVPPVIVSFALNPTQIQTTECTLISWQVSGDVERIQITRNGDIVLDNAPFTGSQQDCPDVGGSYAYRLNVLGENGETEFSQQTLTVIDSPIGPPLEGTNWILDRYNDGFGNMIRPLEGTEITAVFGVDSNVTGSSGCNTYAASYIVDGNSLSIGAPSGTQQLCETPTDIMTQEQAYLTLLPTSNSFSLSSGFLSISDANGRLILQYITRER